MSPGLSWQGTPAGAKSIALIVSDPDAFRPPFIHWILYNLPPETTHLREGVPNAAQLPDGSLEGINGFDLTGYGGPCPPGRSTHRYVFTLFALDTRLDLKPNATEKEVRKAMAGHILAQGSLTGRYHK